MADVQTTLLQDLADLKKSLSKFENAALKATGDDAARLWGQVEYYRDEVRKVRDTLLSGVQPVATGA